MKLKLKPQERTDRLWSLIEEDLKAELETLRRKNDADLTPEQTWKLRGRIAQIKDVLAIASEAPVDRD